MNIYEIEWILSNVNLDYLFADSIHLSSVTTRHPPKAMAAVVRKNNHEEREQSAPELNVVLVAAAWLTEQF